MGRGQCSDCVSAADRRLDDVRPGVGDAGHRSVAAPEEMTRKLLQEILSVDLRKAGVAMPLCDGDFGDVVPEMVGLSSRTLVGMMASREDAAFVEV